MPLAQAIRMRKAFKHAASAELVWHRIPWLCHHRVAAVDDLSLARRGNPWNFPHLEKAALYPLLGLTKSYFLSVGILVRNAKRKEQKVLQHEWLQ